MPKLIFAFLGLLFLLGGGKSCAHLDDSSEDAAKPAAAVSANAPAASNSAAPSNTAVAANADPGARPAGPGQSLAMSVASGGAARSYILHIPASYDASRRYPLMISYHGMGGHGAGQEQKTGFDAVADVEGFFVAYPDAVNGEWQPLGAGNDITFTSDLIADIEHRYPIDASRIYISGFSKGGGFAQILGCVMAAQIAGFADVSSDLTQGIARRCRPAAPVTAVFFHGTADPVSPYNGGDNYRGANTYTAQQTAEFWVSANGCPPRPAQMGLPDVSNDGTTVSAQTWGPCRNGTSVTFYTITNGGHTWPGGGEAKENRGLTSRDINASQIIWQVLSGARR